MTELKKKSCRKTSAALMMFLCVCATHPSLHNRAWRGRKFSAFQFERTFPCSVIWLLWLEDWPLFSPAVTQHTDRHNMWKSWHPYWTSLQCFCKDLTGLSWNKCDVTRSTTRSNWIGPLVFLGFVCSASRPSTGGKKWCYCSSSQ